MSGKTLVDPQQICWLILVSNDEHETSELIDKLKQVPAYQRLVESLLPYQQNWKAGRLPTSDFLHCAKCIIEQDVRHGVTRSAKALTESVLRERRQAA